MNGYVLEDVPDPADPTKLVLQKGKQVASFAVLRDDGKTACGCWIYSGCFNEAGNNMARRDTVRPGQHGSVFEVGIRRGRSIAAFSTIAPRRICRASPGIQAASSSNGTAAKWTGYDVPDIAPTAKPDVVEPFIMNPEGTARLWVRRHDEGRSIPGALRAVRKPDRQRHRANDPGQPGGPRVQGRHGGVRRRRRSSPTRRSPTG